MSDTQPSGPDASEVDRLVAECIEAIERGQPDPVPAACHARPDLLARVRKRLDRLMAHGLLSMVETAPEAIGPYRIVRQLGRGGMGVVYLGEQQQPMQRRVAVKVIKLGMDSREVLARFRQEQQALALMAHEGIAKVFDCGVTERGQPYFVMELVHGQPIDAYCEQRRLPLAARLELMQQACAAVTHAHQKGIVHRDLTPNNVLVQDEGGAPRIKVIDFGLAKVMGQPLVDGTLVTEAGRVMGTPEYMAPEQADPGNADVDTRADVYALGVMLYELLTGTLPFASTDLRQGGAVKMQRVLREVDPPRPSTRVATPGWTTSLVAAGTGTTPAQLQRVLRNDLDWVVLKAMEKDRARRYDSPAALAADLQRFLDHEPLAAGPPTALYRLQKLARRYRPQLAAAAAVVVASVAFGAVALVQWRRAEAAAVVAADNAALADRRAVDNAQLAAAEAAAKRAAERSVAQFDQLAGGVRLKNALARRDELWPLVPALATPLADWLAEADAIVALRPQLAATVAELRAQASPLSPAEVEANRRLSGKQDVFAREQQLLASLRRAQRLREGREPLVLPDLPPELRGAPAMRLNAFAWVRVAPEGDELGKTERTIFGEESLGLAAARAAVAAAAGLPDEHEALDTAAWAAIANGQDDEARRHGEAMLAKAPAGRLGVFRAARQRIEVAVTDAAQRLGYGETRVARIAAEVDARRLWTFDGPQGGARAFLHDTLAQTIDDLERFERAQRPEVARRRQWVEQVAAATAAHPNARATWAAARDAIARADGVVASERYAGNAIVVPEGGWPGLVPLGMNPVTKLWEFYDLFTAWDGAQPLAAVAIPEHAADGSIAVGPATGIVFALLPGGDFLMGAQAADRSGDNYDPAAMKVEVPHAVTLAPFLLARHEITRAQWARLTSGPAGSWIDGQKYNGDAKPVGPTHPVESVSWQVATLWLGRHGLALPTEAQWEYGCRAGTATPWWTGAAVADLADVANVHDQTNFATMREWGEPAPYRDGSCIAAAVGSFRANPFGLHEVHGNVFEWCQDVYGGYGDERPGDGLRLATKPGFRIIRGGSFSQKVNQARASARDSAPPEGARNFVGVRPARLLPR